jgi:hypothetical protein
MNFVLDPNAIQTARASLLLLALPDAPENVEQLYRDAETALRRTYGDLDRTHVTTGELRRAAICGSLRRVNVGEIVDAANRLAA